MKASIAELQQLKNLLTELARRVERFNQPMFSVSGLEDIVELSVRIERLQTKLELPRVTEIRGLTGRDVINVKVWDPLFPGRPGVLGALTQGAEFNPHVNHTNIPVVIDYLARSERYLDQMIREEQEDRRVRDGSSNPTALESLHSILRLLIGDPKSRVPKFLMAVGAGAMLSKWWVPIVHAAAIKYLGLPLGPLAAAEAISFWTGLCIFSLGFLAWAWMIGKGPSRTPEDVATPKAQEHVAEPAVTAPPGFDLGVFKVVPEHAQGAPSGEASTPDAASDLAKVLANRHYTEYHIYLMRSDGTFTQDLGIVRPSL